MCFPPQFGVEMRAARGASSRTPHPVAKGESARRPPRGERAGRSTSLGACPTASGILRPESACWPSSPEPAGARPSHRRRPWRRPAPPSVIKYPAGASRRHHRVCRARSRLAPRGGKRCRGRVRGTVSSPCALATHTVDADVERGWGHGCGRSGARLEPARQQPRGAAPNVCVRAQPRARRHSGSSRSLRGTSHVHGGGCARHLVMAQVRAAADGIARRPNPAPGLMASPENRVGLSAALLGTAVYDVSAKSAAGPPGLRDRQEPAPAPWRSVAICARLQRTDGCCRARRAAVRPVQYGSPESPRPRRGGRAGDPYLMPRGRPGADRRGAGPATTAHRRGLAAIRSLSPLL